MTRQPGTVVNPTPQELELIRKGDIVISESVKSGPKKVVWRSKNYLALSVCQNDLCSLWVMDLNTNSIQFSDLVLTTAEDIEKVACKAIIKAMDGELFGPEFGFIISEIELK